MKSLLRALILCSCSLLAIACDDYRFKYFGIVDPTPPFSANRILFTSPFGFWHTNARILSVSGNRCNLPFKQGQVSSNIPWRITGAPGSILLEQNTSNLTDLMSFSGPFSGQDFNVFTSAIRNPLISPCFFRDSKIVGRFSSDFTKFEATEDLTWGEPGAEVIVRRAWEGSHTQD